MAELMAKGAALPSTEHRFGGLLFRCGGGRRGKPSCSWSPRGSSSSSLAVGGDPACRTGLHGARLVLGGGSRRSVPVTPSVVSSPVQSNQKTMLTIGKPVRWWEKGLQPNMKEIESADDLVQSLLGAGDKLVIVDFFSPGCGGCRALHPKICQFAEMYPDVQFLQVNYELHKSMCYSLHVHVLPFFRFYRGAQGKLCSFSCTNATIKKFKDALAKHTPERCSLGPPKGLEEEELLALAANKDLSFQYIKQSESDLVLANQPLPEVPVPLNLANSDESEESAAPGAAALAALGR